MFGGRQVAQAVDGPGLRGVVEPVPHRTVDDGIADLDGHPANNEGSICTRTLTGWPLYARVLDERAYSRIELDGRAHLCHTPSSLLTGKPRDHSRVLRDPGCAGFSTYAANERSQATPCRKQIVEQGDRCATVLTGLRAHDATKTRVDDPRKTDQFVLDVIDELNRSTSWNNRSA